MKSLVAAYKNRNNIQYRIRHIKVNGELINSIPEVKYFWYKQWAQIIQIYDRYYDDIRIDDVKLSKEQAEVHIEGYKAQLLKEKNTTETEIQTIK